MIFLFDHFKMGLPGSSFRPLGPFRPFRAPIAFLRAAMLVFATLAALCSGGIARAQDSTNSSSGTDFNSFRIIAERNIFDPTRSGRVSRGPRDTRPPAAVSFSFSGPGYASQDAKGDAALFNGYGCPYRQLYAGDIINGFKIVQILPPSETNGFRASVLLAESNSPPITLYQGMQMRREENGPWKVSDQVEPAVEFTSTTDTNAKPGTADGDSSSSAKSKFTPNAAESSILERLRKQREAEDK